MQIIRYDSFLSLSLSLSLFNYHFLSLVSQVCATLCNKFNSSVLGLQRPGVSQTSCAIRGYCKQLQIVRCKPIIYYKRKRKHNYRARYRKKRKKKKEKLLTPIFFQWPTNPACAVYIGRDQNMVRKFVSLRLAFQKKRVEICPEIKIETPLENVKVCLGIITVITNWFVRTKFLIKDSSLVTRDIRTCSDKREGNPWRRRNDRFDIKARFSFNYGTYPIAVLPI